MYEELKKLAEAATAGPWVHGGNWVSTARGNSVADCPRGDEEFIAAANPTTVLALIAENEVLRKAAQWVIQVHRDPELSHEIPNEEWLEDLEAAMAKDLCQ